MKLNLSKSSLPVPAIQSGTINVTVQGGSITFVADFTWARIVIYYNEMRRRSFKTPVQNDDPRNLPAYRVVEAARYLNIPTSTLRSWVSGQNYRTHAGRQFFQPVIAPSSRKPPLLSFLNLIEAHVLDAIRREHGIPLPKIRVAIDYLAQRFPSEHPLATQEFETDGLNLFVEKFGRLINISQAGQLAMRQILQAYLRRIERDSFGSPCKLFPFTRKGMPDEPRAVVIDPYFSFGRPVLVGTGVPTSEIADRYKAGESIESLADDYGRDRLEIEDAIPRSGDTILISLAQFSAGTFARDEYRVPGSSCLSPD